MSAFKWCVLALAGSFVVSGCGSKGGVYQPKPAKGIPVAKVSPGEEASLMPLVVGNQWVYEMAAQLTAPNGQRETRSGVIVYTVKSVKPNATGDGKIATIEVRGENAEKVGDVQVWEINKKGIFQRSISLKNVPFEPMLPAIVFPVETGRTFTWEGSGVVGQSKVGRSKVKNTILAPQEVDTAEGRLSAIPVETVTTYEQKELGSSRSMVFFAPGVGIIRYRQVSASPSGRLEQALVLKRKVVKTST